MAAQPSTISYYRGWQERQKSRRRMTAPVQTVKELPSWRGTWRPSKEKDLCVLSTHLLDLLEHPSSHWSFWRSERSELQIKMENLVRLMLHNTPASHRLPLEKFLCLDQ